MRLELKVVDTWTGCGDEECCGLYHPIFRCELVLVCGYKRHTLWQSKFISYDEFGPAERMLTLLRKVRLGTFLKHTSASDQEEILKLFQVPIGDLLDD